MKVILIADRHNLSNAPKFLFALVNFLNEKKLKCKIGLEMPMRESLERFLFKELLQRYEHFPTEQINQRLYQMRERKFYIEGCLELFDFFPADISNDSDIHTRDRAMASMIYQELTTHSVDIIPVMVGMSHVVGIINELETLNSQVDILPLIPIIKPEPVFFSNQVYPEQAIEYIIKKDGVFYSEENWLMTRSLIQAFIEDKLPKLKDIQFSSKPNKE